MTALLETDGLVKEFGGLVATDHVDLTIERGELLSLIGPNGAGKSTLINLITRMVAETEGEIRFEGESSNDLEPHEIVQRGIGKSFQTASIVPELTVEENANIASLGAEHGAFRFNFLTHRSKYPEVEQRALDTLEAVGLRDQKDVRAADLPYGDKRRLEIGIALAAEPDLLLMDEPTAGMSPEETEATVDLVEEVIVQLTVGEPADRVALTARVGAHRHALCRVRGRVGRTRGRPGGVREHYGHVPVTTGESGRARGDHSPRR
jgi:branched-chain amino acid transport system ATP-binding protein